MMNKFTKVWHNFIKKITLVDNKSSQLQRLERRVAKLEKLNVALVKKLISQGHIDVSIPGENSGTTVKDAREERTIH